MKEVALPQNKITLVDDCDYEELSKYRWYAHRKKHTWYARRYTYIDGKRTRILMHRQILGSECIGKQVDHQDGDGLNNQRANLRPCSNTENARNRHKRKGVSQYKGVSWDRRHSKWTAQINFNGKTHHLGYFNREKDAAIQYIIHATYHFGEFANTAFVRAY